MKILLVHNFYQQSGGEDVVFRSEKSMLEENGHEVGEYTDHNDRIEGMSRISVFGDTIWSNRSQKKINQHISQFQPNIVHCHNIFPLISPSIYYTCSNLNIPVIQTLHNFRLLCPKALFYRESQVCERCLGITPPLPAILYGCYRGSRTQSATVSLLLTTHRFLKTWQSKVDVYIALTEFVRRKFIEGGLPADKIVVKPNFIEAIQKQSKPEALIGGENYALFVGRLSEEKGIKTLLKAWNLLGTIQLKIVGDGPLKEMVLNHSNTSTIQYLGQKAKEEVLNLMQNARFLIFPSEWYETFGLVAVEAFSCSTAVIASRLGAIAEIVKDHYTGLHFSPGNAEDLAVNVRWAWEHPEDMAEMGKNARKEYEQKYTAEKNYKMLMAIYERAIE